MTKDINNNNQKINEAVDAYFKLNPETKWFAAKKLMPSLIESGVFHRDKKNGLPLRQFLRTLNAKGELEQIPRLHAERIGVDIYWYFVREGAEFVSNHVSVEPNAKQKRAIERSNSDEVYILDLIDELFDEKGSRKHTFDDLLGDLHKNGETRTELPLDTYYAKYNLALEIIEHSGKKKNAIDSKEEKLTVSGVTRAEQRLKYQKRKKVVLTQKGISLIEIPLDSFEVDASMQLIRKKGDDVRELMDLLSDFID